MLCTFPYKSCRHTPCLLLGRFTGTMKKCHWPLGVMCCTSCKVVRANLDVSLAAVFSRTNLHRSAPVSTAYVIRNYIYHIIHLFSVRLTVASRCSRPTDRTRAVELCCRLDEYSPSREHFRTNTSRKTSYAVKFDVTCHGLSIRASGVRGMIVFSIS